MAVTADKVIVELEARLGRYERDLARAETRFNRTVHGMERGSGRVTASVGSMFASVSRLATVGIAGYGLVALAKTFLDTVDAAKQLEAQLQLATARYGDFGRAQEDVRRIATETRSDLNETGKLYSALMRNALELGITQEQAARATETITKSFIISGSTAAEAAGATRQLNQALQSGVLRGDEFNAMMENAPRLARLLADSLGIPIGQLRAMSREGELTAQTLTTALTDTRFTAALDEEFRQLPVTFDQAMTLVGNAAQETFSRFDAGGEFSSMLVNFILQGTDGMASIGDAAEQAGISTRSAFAGLGDAFDPLLQGAISAFGGINSEILNTRDQIAGLLGLMDQLYNSMRLIKENDFSIANWLGGGSLVSRAGDPLVPRSNLRGRFVEGYDRSERQLQAGAQARRFGLQSRGGQDFAGSAFQRYLNEPDKYDMFGNRIGPAPRPTPVTPRSRGGGRGRSAADQAAREAEREAEEARRNHLAFERALQNANDDLFHARRGLVVAAETLHRMALEEIETERTREAENIARLETERRYTQAEAEQLRLLNEQVAAARVDVVKAEERERIAAEARSLQQAGLENEADVLRAQTQLMSTRGEQRDAALRLLDLEYQLEDLKQQEIIASATATQAQKDIAEARRRALAQAHQSNREGVNRGFESPGQRYARQVATDAANIGDAFEEVGVDALRQLEDGLVSATKKAFGLKGALGDIVGELFRIAYQRAIIGPLADMLFGGGKGGGGIGGFVGSLIGSFAGRAGKSSGGHVQAGQIYPVGENGIELFKAPMSGKIIPNGQLRGGRGGGTAGVVRIEVAGSDLFDVRVTQVAGDVSVQTIRAAAPILVDGAASETFRRLNRPKM